MTHAQHEHGRQRRKFFDEFKRDAARTGAQLGSAPRRSGRRAGAARLHVRG
jgi:hypothetical protein